ncbi:MAG: glucosamine-6-phosphate isomerase [Lentisphaerae bacterium]|jgi:glucosamine-6-phosphate deaminase|nr:glucosamine-6-phosphate isomerase [Lentisphaerota bacterium]MBT4821337.1 glucosamine-6-phosphate isomerase [Lentisphaerota bacterium]MBT5611853.1 glucosamine-6-phosphate isomerase [Lentisphaerota bacterium]MBT7059310.1 glucosamine-6-phosphate isomerase [Lentisphaerota bacterium]MBT7843833.1 glucosamine-6-phosphate isomerase [Lentisphaerota bacterium]
MDRRTEIHNLLKLPPPEVVSRAGSQLVVCTDLDAMHRRFAEEMAAEIRERNVQGLPTRLILPVGPVGQYPFFAEIANAEGLSLNDASFFFMDEYCDAAGRAVGVSHPLSFRAIAEEKLLSVLDPALGLSADRCVFPNQDNIGSLAARIRDAGGIDTCYGGIGIHGHVAFNEPEPGVSAMGPRKVELNDFTVTINAVRAGVGGNLECFPRQAYTLGMAEILGARRIRLFCRNGCEFDWANTVLRLALFGTPGDDYPVTHVRGRDVVVFTDRDTLACPGNLL